MRVVGSIFLIIGLGLFGGAIWWSKHTSDFIGRAAQASGTVVEFKKEWSSGSNGRSGHYSYYPIVEFSADGQSVRFKNPFGRSSPGYAVGAQVPVLYDPAKPANAKINSFGSLWAGPLIMAFLGAIFAAFTGVPLLLGLRRRRKAAWYKIHGEPVMATIRGVRKITNYKVNRRSPWVIEAEWRDPLTGEARLYSSHHLWRDPAEKLSGHKQIRVYSLPSDRGKYWMDTEEIEKT